MVWACIVFIACRLLERPYFGVVAMHMYVGVQLHFFRAQLPRPTPTAPTVMRHIYVICISVALTREQDRQPVTLHPGR